MTAYRPLVALRIPSGWEVRFNNFVELGVLDQLAEPDRDAYLSQDLLMIRSTAPAGAPAAGYVLDLGWAPHGDPGGTYRLRVLGEDANAPVVRFESQHPQVVRDAVSVCLNRLNEGAGPEVIQGLLEEATRGLS